MAHLAVQWFARLTLCATIAHCALACGADSDHGPPIGAPTGPIGPIINEGGSTNGSGGAGQSGGNANAGPNVGTSGSPDVVGIGGSAPFGNGSAGRDPFTDNPFGIGGTPSASAGLGPF